MRAAFAFNEGLLYYLKDNTQAWELQSDGTYVRTRPGEEEPFSAQTALLAGTR